MLVAMTSIDIERLDASGPFFRNISLCTLVYRLIYTTKFGMARQVRACFKTVLHDLYLRISEERPPSVPKFLGSLYIRPHV